MKINEFPELVTLSDDDLLLVWSADTGTTKKAKASTLKAYFLAIDTMIGKLTGTAFGLTPLYSAERGFDKPFDGDNNTFYDYLNPNGGYCGLDLGSNKTITKIRYYPRSDFSGGAARLIGGKFQYSTSANNSGYTDIATIGSAELSTWGEINLSTAVSARYLRYLSPDGGYGNIAEIEVYGY